MPYERVLRPVSLGTLRGLVEQSVEFLYVATDAHGEDQRLAIAMASASTISKARDALAWVLTQSDHAPVPIRSTGDAVGDASFANDASAAQFFVRETRLAAVRSIGRSPVPLTPIMKALDELFRSDATGLTGFRAKL